jgi:hypothetical protein
MPRTRAGRNVGEQDADYDPNNAAPSRTAQPNMPSQQAINATPAIDSALTVDVRTKFPVARIKRIMQADEDVGKVAQATPTAVGMYSVTTLPRHSPQPHSSSPSIITFALFSVY